VVPGLLTGISETLPRYRFSPSGTTTIVLIAQSALTVSTMPLGARPAPAALDNG